jgi:hypothetical protein
MAKRSNSLSRGGPGGGPSSKALAPKVTTYFGGQPSQRVNPGGADQQGQAMGNHSTDSGKALRNPATPLSAGTFGGPGSTKLGNEVALNVGGGGPGAGRTLYGQSGVQGQHGPVNPGKPTPARDILGEFGSESPIVRERK